MAFRIKSQEHTFTYTGAFDFPEPVRQYAIGFTGWSVSPGQEGRDVTVNGQRVALRIKHWVDAGEPAKIRYQIEGGLGGETIAEGSGYPVFANYTIACIADVGGDPVPDSCAVFINEGDGKGARLPGACKIDCTILTGFESERQGDAQSGAWSSSSPHTHGFIAMAEAEGRTFAKVVPFSAGGFVVDFRDKIGDHGEIQEAVAFLPEPHIGQHIMYNSTVAGGVGALTFEGSRVSAGAGPNSSGGQVLVVIRTKAVIVPEGRTEVKLRLSREVADSSKHFWEWQISEDPEHWHRTAVKSDELDWSTAALTVTVLNSSGRPIQLTLGDGTGPARPVGGELATGAWSGVIDLRADGPARNKIWGTFTDNGASIPDPTFTPIKAGGG